MTPIKERIMDRIRGFWIILSESVSSFIRNNDLKSASSLAFYTAVALIPALFLLTYLVGSVLGSSQTAFEKTEALVNQFIPRFSNVILKEVLSISEFRKTLGVLNLVILVWSVTPLVSTLRSTIGEIFKSGLEKHIFVEKLIDLGKIVMILLFFMLLSTVAVVGIALRLIRKFSPVEFIPRYLEILAPFLFLLIVILFLYYLFVPRTRLKYILIGALTFTSLWFIMKPAFNLFLTYNPGYGYTFGSLKSIFIVIIWIYYSQCVFLFGAEVTASLKRKGPILIKRMIAGKSVIPRVLRERYVVRYAKESVIFNANDIGKDMFFVLRGGVSIRKDEKEIAFIEEGKFFGEMAFLLSMPRVAAAVAATETDLIVVNDQNMEILMRESPGMIREMLTEMAFRLRETNQLIE